MLYAHYSALGVGLIKSSMALAIATI